MRSRQGAAVRLDLDELERKARAATQGEWAADRVPGMPRDDDPVLANVIALELDDTGRQQQIADCYDNTNCADKQCEANAAHIAAVSPPTVLALIARIRELEGEARDIGRDLAENFVGEDAEERYGIQEHGKRLLRVAEKGVVLP